MSIVRRISGIVVQCALLAMSLVGSGYACDASMEHSEHMVMADMSMSGMDMHGMEMPGMPAQAPAGGQQNHSDCSFPWSSGDCQGMTSCTPNVMGVDQVSAVSVTLLPHDELGMRAEQLRSVTRAPEPPPPRA